MSLPPEGAYGFCSKCGSAQTAPDAAFCHKCGAAQRPPVDQTPVLAYAPSPVAASTPPVTRPSYGSYAQPAEKSSLDYAKNKGYFSKTNVGCAVLIILVGLPFLAVPSGGAIIGIIAIVAGLGILLMGQGGATDQELDAALDGEIERVRAKALAKLGLDESQIMRIDPVLAGGYDFRPGTLYKKGGDGIWRSSRGEAVAVFFSDDLLHYYKWGFSLIEPNKDDERTDEYFYRDVVSIATITKTITLERDLGAQGKRRLGDISINQFELTTSGGTSVTCAMSSSDRDNSERRVQGARNLIKEKKAAIR